MGCEHCQVIRILCDITNSWFPSAAIKKNLPVDFFFGEVYYLYFFHSSSFNTLSVF